MMADELADKAELASHMSPIEYARARGIAPQKVYYKIRHEKIKAGPCESCGRKVLNVAEADKELGFKKETADAESDTTDQSRITDLEDGDEELNDYDQ